MLNWLSRYISFPSSLLLATAIVIVAPLHAQVSESIAILDIEAYGISQSEAISLSNRLRAALVRTNRAIIVERSQMQEILREQDFNLAGCTSNECAIEVGQLLGVTNMIAGTVGKVGSTFSVDIRVITVESGRIARSLSKDYQGQIDGLLGLMTVIAEELVGVSPTRADADSLTLIQTPITEKGEIQSTPGPGYSFRSDKELFDAISVEDMQSVSVGDSVYYVTYLFGKYRWITAYVVGIDKNNPTRVQILDDDKLRIVKSSWLIEKQPWLVPYNDGFGEYHLSIGSYVIFRNVSGPGMVKGFVEKISFGGRRINITSNIIVQGLLEKKKYVTSIGAIALLKARN